MKRKLNMPDTEVQDFILELHSLVCKKDPVRQCGLAFDSWDAPSPERLILEDHAKCLMGKDVTIRDLSLILDHFIYKS